MKPFEINLALLDTGTPESDTVASLRTALTPVDRTFTCPQCDGSGYVPIDPWVGAGDPPNVECPTCEGYGKTTVEYAAACTQYGYQPA